MFDTIIEKMVKASSYIGDFIMNPRRCIDDMWRYCTLGSVPERSLNSRKGMEHEIKLLHDIEMGRGDED